MLLVTKTIIGVLQGIKSKNVLGTFLGTQKTKTHV